MNDYRTVGKYQISNVVYKTYPCKYIIINTEDSSRKVMLGTEVFHLFEQEGLHDPHFIRYRKNVCPTSERNANIENKPK